MANRPESKESPVEPIMSYQTEQLIIIIAAVVTVLLVTYFWS
jgi:hypothetical protein